ncbi:nicotinate-nucleotide--dimethylbenzimidazole phosphoribosyltransferase [Psychromonas sp. KJ10-10]|uniref:nicotinate-nucleotide--dimethylbenzimidazole phosphoribosyltransferase n=1 Tax=Psychromonas sp. KJ10-10 TaxID=3391823 RepID=UPI0039B432F2
MASLLGLSGLVCCGRGTGVDEQGVKHKAQVVEQSIAFHKLNNAPVLEVIQKVGGFEIVMMIGAMLKAT